MMKLYYSAVSPYVRKIMIVSYELGLLGQIETIPVSLSPYAPNNDVLGLNPLGKIPVLFDDHGEVVSDSSVITEYLLTLSKNQSLLPEDLTQRFRTLTKVSLVDGMLEAAQLVRFELARPEGYAYPEWLDAQTGKILRSIIFFESNLPDRFDLVAVSLCATLPWIELRLPNLKWRENAPQLATWLDNQANRPSVFETRLP